MFLKAWCCKICPLSFFLHAWCCKVVCPTFFPTCQVRVVRFYHSYSSPPPRLAILLLLFFLLLVLLLRLLLQFLLDHVCISSTSTSALPTLRQLPSSVRTAGPQPGTFPAQCASLDLNLGPSQLSARRYAR